MMRKIHRVVFWVGVVAFLLIASTPIDYARMSYTMLHLWLVLLYGFVLLIVFAKKTEGKEILVWILSALLPIAGVVMFFILIVFPNGTDSQVIHIPNKKQFVTSEFSSLFMQGNPVHKITVGYPIIGQALIWKTNSYTKEGLGDSKSVLSNYRLPEKIDLKNYHEVGLFILPDENYLLDCNNDTIYEIQKQP